jgi:hypothetical protein
MTVIVSVKIHDGIVLAADSAVTFPNGQIYHHENKILNLVKGLPIGVMTCGAGSVGSASIVTLLKDLRKRLSGEDEVHPDWKIDHKDCTIEFISSRIHAFFEEKIKEVGSQRFLLFRVCGYSVGRPLSEVWQVAFLDDGTSQMSCPQKEEHFGCQWNGEQEALNRLILGVGTIPEEGLKALGMTADQRDETVVKLVPHIFEAMIMHAAPVQDAIDLARFMVETTIGFTKFSITRKNSVGGPVEIAAITKHEGFKWVQRKHFFPADLNRPY